MSAGSQSDGREGFGTLAECPKRSIHPAAKPPRSGTEASLRAWGFPYDVDRTTLLVKPDFRQDDTAFKEAALEIVAALGHVVLYLDNEPSNVNLFRRRHPEALVVFVETDHSPKPVEPDPAACAHSPVLG